jgi:hypothetical protein
MTKFSEFMTNAIWEAIKAGYESRDLEMVESACRQIRSYLPIDDDPTPAPVPVKESPAAVEDSKTYPNINSAMAGLGLNRDLLISALSGHVAKLPTGKSIDRRDLSPVLEETFPSCKGVLIGSSKNDFSLAFVRAITNRRNADGLAAVGVLNGPDGNLLVKCSSQNVSRFANGHQKTENLSLLVEQPQW